MNDSYAFLDDRLADRKKNHRLRSLSVFSPDREQAVVHKREKRFINFSSNDYLGLADHPQVIAKAQNYLTKYGAGSTASRLICGTWDIHTRLEKTLAKTFERESALVFNSGFQANSSILGTVTDRHSLILADKRSHNSLLQGSLSSRAAFQRFRHNDVDHLESLLQKAQNENYNRIWVVTESVFSMDGDRSPLPEISRLATRYQALLFVDDAHAVGVWGREGLGLAKNISGVDILLGTCGKAFGSFGAYVACSQKMKDYLINFCPGFIYTTALPPAAIGATQAALERITRLKDERKSYHKKIKWLREELQNSGFDTGPSTTQIVPIILGDEQKTLELSNYLQKQGILATAIRPPTVPEHSSRIRLTLTSAHTHHQVQKLMKALKTWKNDQN